MTTPLELAYLFSGLYSRCVSAPVVVNVHYILAYSIYISIVIGHSSSFLLSSSTFSCYLFFSCLLITHLFNHSVMDSQIPCIFLHHKSHMYIKCDHDLGPCTFLVGFTQKVILIIPASLLSSSSSLSLRHHLSYHICTFCLFWKRCPTGFLTFNWAQQLRYTIKSLTTVTKHSCWHSTFFSNLHNLIMNSSARLLAYLNSYTWTNVTSYVLFRVFELIPELFIGVLGPDCRPVK